MVELIARIRAVLRRIRPGLADDRLNNGDIVIFGGYHANAWASFEPYWGTHGSFTGEMVRPFMLTDDAKLITLLSSGASHRDIFRRIRQMRRG